MALVCYCVFGKVLLCLVGCLLDGFALLGGLLVWTCFVLRLCVDFGCKIAEGLV